MKVEPTQLPGVLVIDPRIFGDDRGYFLEAWQYERYRDAGVDASFVQDNLSFSHAGVLRGLHLQNPHPQAKLVQVLVGEVFDVAVDLRGSSPTFGKWTGTILSADNQRELWIPVGFAHGFLVLSESADFVYKTTDYYAPEHERSLLWSDPDIGIEWPLKGEPTLAAKDRAGKRLRDAETFP